MKKALLVFIACLAIDTFSFASQLTQTTPDEMIDYFEKKITTVLKILKTENDNNSKLVKQKVIDETIDLFDYNRLAALAVGFPWKSASLIQKEQLSQEFKYKLINSYFNSLLRIGDTKVEVNKTPITRNNREFILKTTVLSNNPNLDKTINIDYFFYNTDAGYKIYNINVEGVSLVTGFRNEFEEVIQKKGIDGLIEKLKYENNQSSNGFKDNNLTESTKLMVKNQNLVAAPLLILKVLPQLCSQRNFSRFFLLISLWFEIKCEKSSLDVNPLYNNSFQLLYF